MVTKPDIEHALNEHGGFCAECEEPWPCEVTRLRAENERLVRERDGARMIIGPLSDRPTLLDATDDVVRELERLRAENEQLRRDVNIREIRMRQAETRQESAEDERDALRAENERLRAVVEAARHVLATRRVSAAGSGWVALEDALTALDEHKRA